MSGQATDSLAGRKEDAAKDVCWPPTRRRT